MTIQPTGSLSLDDPLLSTNKVAAMFDVSPETIRDWIASGKIEGVKINRSWRVRRSVAIALGEKRYGDPTQVTDDPQPGDSAVDEPVPDAGEPAP